MTTATIRPLADGTTTGFTRVAASGTFAARIVDDPDSNDGDTSYVMGPNVSDGSMWVTLDALPSDFDAARVVGITLKAAAKKVEGGISQLTDTVDLYLQIQRTDESTAISTESTVCNVTDTTNYVLFTRTVAVSGTHSVANWNAAKLKIRQDYTVQQMADTTAQIRVTAVEIIVDYVLGGAALGVSEAPHHVRQLWQRPWSRINNLITIPAALTGLGWEGIPLHVIRAFLRNRGRVNNLITIPAPIEPMAEWYPIRFKQSRYFFPNPSAVDNVITIPPPAAPAGSCWRVKVSIRTSSEANANTAIDVTQDALSGLSAHDIVQDDLGNPLHKGSNWFVSRTTTFDTQTDADDYYDAMTTAIQSGGSLDGIALSGSQTSEHLCPAVSNRKNPRDSIPDWYNCKDAPASQYVETVI